MAKKELVGMDALKRLISLIKTTKQDKKDDNLKTNDKTITGAINEVNEKAGKKEIVLVDIQKMLEEQDTTLFMDLSRRYENGEIVIVGSLENQYGIISGIRFIGENAHWVVTSGAWGEPMLEGGEFKPSVTVYGLECDGEKIVIGSGSIENPDLSDYVKFENRDTFVKEGLTETEETWTDDEKLSAQKLLGIDNRFNIINAILSQSGIVKKYKQPITQEYTERVTADGANVYDGSKAILEKVVGNTVRCENLIQYPYADTPSEGNTVAKAGITFTDNGDGSITVNGTATQNTNFILSSSSNQRVRIHKVGSYHLSGSTDGGSVSTYYMALQVRKGDTFLAGTNITDSNGLNFNVSEETFNSYDNVYLYFWIAKGQTFNNTKFKPMLNEGSTALPYQPYFTGLKSASFAGLESKNADGTEKSTLSFPKMEMPLGTTIDFESKKIVNYGVELVLTGEELWTVSPGYTVNNTYYSSMYAKCLTSNENRTFGIATEGTVRSGQSGVYGHGVWWIGTGGLYLYLLGAEQYFNFTQFADPNNPTDEEKENLKTEWKAYLAQRYADGNPVTIRYVSSTLQSETDFTEEQSASGNEYIAYKGGTEKALDNDGEKYGADNTLTQDYILVAEVD